MQLPTVFIMVLIVAILLFSVLQPILNSYVSNATGSNTFAWNMSGYDGARQVSQTLPLMFVLIFFVAVALVVLKEVGTI